MKQSISRKFTWVQFVTIFSALLVLFASGCNSTSGNGEIGEDIGVVVESIEISPAALSLSIGDAHELTATVNTSNDKSVEDNRAVVWASSDPDIVAVSTCDSNGENCPGAPGTVIAVDTGSVTISATADNVTRSIVVTVGEAELVALQISDDATVAIDYEHAFTATGIYSNNEARDVTDIVAWTTLDTAIATINDADRKGIALGVAEGSTTVTASIETSSGDTKQASAIITVKDISLREVVVEVASENGEDSCDPTNLAQGLSCQLTATAEFTDDSTTDVTTQVTWASDCEASASVDENGLVTGVNPTADTAGCNAAVAISANYSPQGTSGSSETGSIDITVTDKLVTSITISPSTAEVACGASQQYTANAVYSDDSTGSVTNDVTWVTSNTTYSEFSATVNGKLETNCGDDTATFPQTSDITASLNGQTSNTAALTIKDKQADEVVISACDASDSVTPIIPRGSRDDSPFCFCAEIRYSDGTSATATDEVLWSSSDSSIVTISNATNTEGCLGDTANSNTGTATITATSSEDTGSLSNSTTVTISNAALNSISITPADGEVEVGKTLQYTATGHYSDNSTVDLTTTVTWAIPDDADKASISNASNKEGQAKGLATATDIRVTAVHGSTGKGAETTLDVVPSTSVAGLSVYTLASGREIDCDNPSFVTGSPIFVASDYDRQFYACAVYDDGHRENVTATATWSMFGSGTGQATVVRGLVSPTQVGSERVVATLDGEGSFISISIEESALSTLTVSPSTLNLTVSNTGQLLATGTFQNGQSMDLTAGVNWSEGDANTATVSNSGSTKGLVTGHTVGSTQVTATGAGDDSLVNHAATVNVSN